MRRCFVSFLEAIFEVAGCFFGLEVGGGRVRVEVGRVFFFFTCGVVS